MAHAWLIRRILYPLWEWREGGRVLPLLEELRASQWLAPQALEDMQLRRLRGLVAHAAERSPYYRDAFARAGVRPEEISSLADLRRLPVLPKADLRDHLAAIRTGPVEKLVKRQTSGSTGIPLVVWAEPLARDAWAAALFRFLEWWEIRPGDRRVSLISRMDLTAQRWWKQLLIANVIEISAMDLSTAALDRLTRWLERGRTTALLGYPSSLVFFAQHLLARGAGPYRLRAVIATGEMLYDDHRALMRRAFGCPVINEYGSSETGHIAGECPAGSLHIAAENVLAEVTDAGADGGAAGELLLTDLTNRATPLIRYQIGDRGRPGGACDCGRGLPVLEELAGRVSELVVFPDGRRADFTIVAGVIESLAENGIPLRQYQVIQRTPAVLEILLAGPDSLAGAGETLRYRLREALPAPIEVEVRVVDAIPAEPSGKRRRFISSL